ncbi:hypothetical protein HRG_004429 [Hirsutella rhossiliensis]|uniref:2EXR domain-containing protein n=1 Tax=Hirsutella rhossiliensis TaxID=111463 RepID=A0A9P8N130_9HYPO|nr:uncharacterized protein HRG_04429 [Hirsutella rhossiliensis]KAH0964001.1 hypothetical protein HRG_04429 [Hirsutella rhossiliensis]
MASASTPTPGPSAAAASQLLRSKFALLPAELRLKIWSCAVEARVAILDDLVQKTRSYPIPPVTQLNVEARTESRRGYEAVGRGSHLHFSRDIVVCDATLCDLRSSKPLEELAPRVRRLAFWDCFPDDGRVDVLQHYSAYVAACFPHQGLGRAEFDKFWFPNLSHLWIVKVGEVDRSWNIAVDKNVPFETQARKTARQFRYWINGGIIEMATLDLDEPETKAVLREGRCGRADCRELNRERPTMVSKVTFIDGPYNDDNDDRGAPPRWKRIRPWSACSDDGCSEDRMRWMLVERTLTFSLRWEGSGEDHEASTTRRQVYEDANGGGGRRREAVADPW